MARTTKTNLVEPASTFVGRDDELEALGALFESHARWVTLLGPGGIGKTRLAQRFAAEQQASYRRAGGVWFVDLTSADSVAAAAAVVARVLRATGPATVDERLARLGRVLIVLDNLEHLAEALAGPLQAWVRAAPSVRWLATSRRPIGFEGEHVFTISPLARDHAVALLLGRARLIRPIAEAQVDLALLGEVVDAIDCMPLAIELAASRTHALSFQDLRARLDDPLKILRRRGPSLRHGSVERAVLDSVTLLSAAERRVFALASVLRNGFTLEDAEATLVGRVDIDVFEALESLVRTSLLRAQPGAARAVIRYSFFETIREVASTLALDEPDVADVQAAHARAFAARARDATARVAAEDLENLEAAFGRARDLSTAAPDAWAIDLAWLAIGLEEAGSAAATCGAAFERAWAGLSSLGDRSHPAERLALRGRVRLGRGRARRALGELADARADFDAAHGLFQQAASDPAATAAALAHLGELDDVQGDTAAARRGFEAALKVLQGAPRGATRDRQEADVRRMLGHALRREGELAAARRTLRAAAEAYRRLDDAQGLSQALYELGVVDLFDGPPAAAMKTFDEGLEVAREGDVRFMEGTLLNARGCCFQDQGDLPAALESHARAAQILGAIGHRYREASALYYLATAHTESGAFDDALAVLAHARRRIEPVRSPRYAALMAACAASAHVLRGDEGDSDAARDELSRAHEARARVPGEPALQAGVYVHDRLVRRALGDDACSDSEVLADAKARVEANSNDDSRFALRLLRQVLRGRFAQSDEAVLLVHDGLDWFRAPGMQDPARLPARSPLRRILSAFLTRRVDAPGDALSIDEVIAAGWPEEKIGAEAALNRAYVALATLRKKGLRGVLVRVDGGWALSPATAVRWAGTAA